MRKRKTIGIVAAVVVVVLVGLFIIYGVPLIRDMFTPPIAGLPTASASNSLQARFTQTAAARLTAVISPTPNSQ